MNEIDHSILYFNDFESASRAVLKYLHDRIGFDLWMMTRTQGRDWIVLQAEDHGYNVKEGSVFNWYDSFCSRMVKGLGPQVAPKADLIPAYLKAPIGQQVEIGAYIGVPIPRKDGSLFGTLCAIDPDPKDESIENEFPTIELLAKLLGTILIKDMDAIEQFRILEKAKNESFTDDLTGLLNRRGWDSKIAIEEERSRIYGNQIFVLMLEIENFKDINDKEGSENADNYLKSVAKILQGVFNEKKIVARIQGPKFGCIVLDCDNEDSDKILEQITQKLSFGNITISFGTAYRRPDKGVYEAIEEANCQLMAMKKK